MEDSDEGQISSEDEGFEEKKVERVSFSHISEMVRT